MKHQYTGDVNDYRDYAVLRRVVARGLSLGVVWMLSPDDGSTDGQKIDYLSKPAEWRAFDPELFDALKAIVDSGARTLGEIERANLFEAAFFGETVPREIDARRSWFDRALAACAGRDVVFLDPDNGIEVATAPPGSRLSVKYALWSELDATYAAGHSVILHQHFPREDRVLYATRLARQVQERLTGATVFSLHTPQVLLLIAAQPQHAEKLEQAAHEITAVWGAQIRFRR